MKKLIVLFGILALLVIVWYKLPWYLSTIIPDSDEAQATRGQYGDMYGVITSLFSAITVVGLIATIWLQQEELSETRKEFRQQNETLIHQRFENTFFQLIKFHNDNVKNIDLIGSNTTIGKDCFKVFYSGLKDILWQMQEKEFAKMQITTSSQEEYEYMVDQVLLSVDVIKACYNRFYSGYEGDLGHYFKTMYRLVRYVDEAKHFTGTTEEIQSQKKFYTGILRAQLSNYEQYLLAYNSIGTYGEKFLVLINKYDLLDGCDFGKMSGGYKVQGEMLTPTRIKI